MYAAPQMYSNAVNLVLVFAQGLHFPGVRSRPSKQRRGVWWYRGVKIPTRPTLSWKRSDSQPSWSANHSAAAQVELNQNLAGVATDWQSGGPFVTKDIRDLRILLDPIAIPFSGDPDRKSTKKLDQLVLECEMGINGLDLAALPVNFNRNLARPIFFYTMGSGDGGDFYEYLNRELRQLSRADPAASAAAAEKLRPFMRCILNSMDKLPEFRGQLYRAVNVEARVLKAKYLPGTTVTWSAFTSCSTKFLPIWKMTMVQALKDDQGPPAGVASPAAILKLEHEFVIYC